MFGRKKIENGAPVQKKKFSYTGFLKKCLIISGSIMLVGLLVACIWGVRLDINFKGGSRYTFSYKGNISSDKAESVLRKALGVPVDITESRDYSGSSAKLVVTVNGGDIDKIDISDSSATSSTASASSAVSSSASSSSTSSTASQTSSTASGSSSEAASSEPSDSAEKSEPAISGVEGAMLTALKAAFPKNDVEFGDSNTVSPTMAARFFGKCFAALVIASVLLLIYIAFRFRNIGGFSAGVMSLIALVHDLLIAFIACIIFRLEIDMNFIAVVLTILGYSLNDTIVVYDRIRENRKLYPQKSLRELADESLLQVTNRTITTSVATFIAVMAILVVCELNGLTTLRTFTIPMAFGIISGSYSSLCLAAPLWVKWNEYREKHPRKKKDRKRKANAGKPKTAN